MRARYVLTLAALLTVALTSTAHAATAPYLTLFADRAQLVEADCTTKQALPGTVPLDQVIRDMDARGLQGTFGVVTKFINESTHRCANPALYPSWDDLSFWHSRYGWEATSNGKTKLILTSATDQQLQDETCGSLPLFTSHGFQRAWGMFSYPSDSSTLTPRPPCCPASRRPRLRQRGQRPAGSQRLHVRQADPRWRLGHVQWAWPCQVQLAV